MLPAWVKHQIVDINKVANVAVCAEFSMSSKFHFSQRKTFFSQLIVKFLQFEVMEYLIHYDSNLNSFILRKLPILF